MGQYQTFILYISAGNYYYEVIFGKDPFLRTLYLKMAPNPIISQIYFFVTSHFGTLLPVSRTDNFVNAIVFNSVAYIFSCTHLLEIETLQEKKN